MLQNLIKYSLRSFRKQGAYVIINILGLSIGITCSLFIAFYVMNEVSYDRYNKKKDRIFRLIQNVSIKDEYYFVDDDIKKMYIREKQNAQMAVVFSILAIFIASLGLFGLTSFIVDKRTPEIWIRKAMGSPVGSIYLVISRKTIILISISALIAWPIIYYIAGKWLENFYYRINPGVFSFIAGFSIAMGISVLTISYRILRAARINPAQSLKYE